MSAELERLREGMTALIRSGVPAEVAAELYRLLDGGDASSDVTLPGDHCGDGEIRVEWGIRDADATGKGGAS